MVRTDEELIQSASDYTRSMVDFLQDLVRIPSVNGRDSEETLADRVLQEAARLGIAGRIEAKNSKRPNAVVTLGEGHQGFALIAHMDTVAEGSPERWTHAPFAGEIADGRLFGRGAADNKAGIACGMYTLALLRDQNLIDPAREKVILACVSDEESGACSDLGVRYLLDQDQLPVRAAIYTYTSDIICTGHRGLLRLEVQARGQSVHAGLLEWHQGKAGINAVTGLADLLLQLEQLEIRATSPPGFEKLGCTITPGTIFHGGSYESIVPDGANATVDVRLLPGQDPASVLAEVDQIIARVEKARPGLHLSYGVKVNIPGASIPVDHPLVTVAQDFTERLTGRRWAAEGAGPANEGYMLISKGIPTLCGFGPTGGNPHAPDEWVLLDSLPVTAGMYAGIIQAFLAG